MNRESEAIGLIRVVSHASWCVANLCSERTFKFETTTTTTTTTTIIIINNSSNINTATIYFLKSNNYNDRIDTNPDTHYHITLLSKICIFVYKAKMCQLAFLGQKQQQQQQWDDRVSQKT